MSTHDPDHPTFPFTSGLTRSPSLSDWLNTRRVAGKPTFIYETMVFKPQKYRIEFPYRLLALAAVQDLDVIDFHYYGHPPAFPWIDNPYGRHTDQYAYPEHIWQGCIMRNDEVLMSALRIAGEAFKGGYLRPAAEPTTITLGRQTLWGLDTINGGKWAGAAEVTAFRHGLQWAFDPEQELDTVHGSLADPEKVKDEQIAAPTNQIAYRWHEGLLVIDAPQVKTVVGKVPSNFDFDDGFGLRDITIAVPDGMPFATPGERYAGIGLASTDGRSLSSSRHIQLSAMSTSFNSNFAVDLEKMQKDTAYAHGLARSITHKGTVPVLFARVGLKLRADWLTGRRYRMIDYNGKILSEGTIRHGELTIPSNLPVYLTLITMPR